MIDAIAFDAMLADAGVPPETRMVVTALLPLLPPGLFTAMIQDATRIKTLHAQGHTEEARAAMESYRESAEEAGFGPVFDQMFAGVFGDGGVTSGH